jgi:anti-sigma factor RsiW
VTAMNHREAVETLALERYLLGEMADQERDAFEEHFFSCAECAEDARAGDAMRDAVAAGMATTAATKVSPAGRLLTMPAPRRRLASVVVPWAAAASLALVAGYQAFIAVPALKRNARPTVLAPVTLRPASRGQETVVVSSTGALITLAVDLGGGVTNGSIDYEIRQADGKSIASDRVPAPTDGSPLLLLVPAELLQPGQHYVLVVKNSGNDGLTPADYRFTVGAR